MSGVELSDASNVVRYVKPSLIAGKELSYEAFCLRAERPDESGLSVNWLEYFGDFDKSERLEKIRGVSNLRRARNGRYAEINVGKLRAMVAGYLNGFAVTHSPIHGDDGRDSDPSHSEIKGLPPGNTKEGRWIGERIARCVIELHPAVGDGY